MSKEDEVGKHPIMSSLEEGLKEMFGAEPDLCLNCSLAVPLEGFPICRSCLDNALELDAMLDEGISIEYADGSRELLNKNNVSKKSVGINFEELIDQLRGKQL